MYTTNTSPSQGDTCHVVFVKSITFETPSQSTETAAPPGITNSLKPFPPPTPNLIELPTCPVCLERMDDTNGLITIACQHVFHCICLKRWQGGGCPVCRFASPNDDIIPGAPPFGQGVANLCSVCDCTSDLWICLICGRVGCGRYKGGHAKDHWKETAHNFALEIETQHVWDYGDDKWVHRLIREKGNGKLVELPAQQAGPSASRGNPTSTFSSDDYVPREKYEAVGMEYSQLLTNQLESQRIYFEDMLTKATEKAAQASAMAERSMAQQTDMAQRMQDLEAKYAELTMQTIPQLEREVEREKTRAGKAQDLARSLGKAVQEEKQVSNGLFTRIEHLLKSSEQLETENQEMKAEIAGLQEMNHDLTMFISGQEKLKEMEQEGMIDKAEMEGASTSAPEKKNRRRKK